MTKSLSVFLMVIFMTNFVHGQSSQFGIGFSLQVDNEANFFFDPSQLLPLSPSELSQGNFDTFNYGLHASIFPLFPSKNALSLYGTYTVNYRFDDFLIDRLQRWTLAISSSIKAKLDGEDGFQLGLYLDLFILYKLTGTLDFGFAFKDLSISFPSGPTWPSSFSLQLSYSANDIFSISQGLDYLPQTECWQAFVKSSYLFDENISIVSEMRSGWTPAHKNTQCSSYQSQLFSTFLFGVKHQISDSRPPSIPLIRILEPKTYDFTCELTDDMSVSKRNITLRYTLNNRFVYEDDFFRTQILVFQGMTGGKYSYSVKDDNQEIYKWIWSTENRSGEFFDSRPGKEKTLTNCKIKTDS